jgi:molybdopterin molybdotransferase
MLTPAEAAGKIRATLPELESLRVPLAGCSGRVLARPVVAERDQPPFDRVMMDGIAIAHGEFAAGSRSFRVQATQAAGDAALELEEGSAIEIMTGASLPDGADCIIPIERVTLNEHGAHVEANYGAEHRQFIHPRGSDHGKGEQLLVPGTRITPTEVAVIASAGLAEVDVARLPCIRVISTGNELVSAGQPIAPHQIRLSNGPAIVAMLAEHGYTDTEHDHIPDDPTALEKRVGAHLEAADVLVLSGGVSMGKADFVPEVLAGLGVSVVFHRISQRPGRPMWYGVGPAGQAVFALPGNPVSTLVCCRQYVLPALRQMSGMAASRPEFASLTQAVRFTPALTNFLPVKLVSNAQGQILALPVKTNTSGDFTALAGTDGYVELEARRNDFPQGTVVPLHRWRL